MSASLSRGGAPSFGVGAAWASLTGRQRNAFLASYLGWALDAFDFFILVMVLRHVEHDFAVSSASVTQAIFVTLAMRPVGAVVFGLLADRYGRRPILMFNVAFFSVMELLSGLAPTWGWFLVLRALFGFGMGGEWGIGSSLVMESVPAQTRGVLSGILQQGYPVGYLLAALLYKFAFPLVGWRGMFFIGCAPALLVLFIRQFVDESPAWQEAHRSPGKGSLAAGGGLRSVREALAGQWRLLLYLALLMAAFNFFSHGTQDLYPSKFLEGQRGLSRDTVSNIAVVYNLGAICGGITFGTWSQIIGRRRAIVTAALLSLLMIPAWAFAKNPWGIAAAAFFMQFCVQGAWGVVPAHLNELSPGSLRGTFPGLAYQLGNLLAASTPNLQAWLASRHGGDLGFALAWSVAVGAVVLAVVAGLGTEARTAVLTMTPGTAPTGPAAE